MADTVASAPAASKAASGRLPLAGIRVLDFTQILAGPFCTRLLADLGAEVLKVETATRPDRTSATRPDPEAKGRTDRPPAFLNTNRNKQSITINLKTPAGKDLATRLGTRADIAIENFSADVMDRLGLGYKDLSPLNPRLIFVAMAGYGHTGPRREWTSMNMNLQAYTGLLMVNGAEGDLPTAISNSWNDYIGGLHATFGILNALTERRVTGKGAFLDLAQFECSVSTLAPLLVASAATGRAPTRLGNRSTRVAPQGCYRCDGNERSGIGGQRGERTEVRPLNDEWCVISVQNDAEWQALVGIIGSQLADDRFATVMGRTRHQDDIDAVIEAWTSQRSKEEVQKLLDAAGVTSARMRRIKEVMQEPGPTVFREMEDPPGHTILATGDPFSFKRSAIASLAPAAGLGQHSESALGEWLGLTAQDVKSLNEQGALV